MTIRLVDNYTGTKPPAPLGEVKRRRKRTHPKSSDKRLDMAAMLGTRAGRLLLREIGPNEGAHKTFRCLCDCGNVKIVRAEAIRRGKVKSCGCYQKEIGKVTGPMSTEHYIRQTVGREFGMRTVVAATEHRDANGERLYLTRCVCGVEELRTRHHLLKSGACRSCWWDGKAESTSLSDDDATP